MSKHLPQLETDLNTLLHTASSRRQMLRWLGAGGAVSLLGCGGGSDATTTMASTTTTSTSTTTGSSSTAGTSSSCSVIPEETAGPYPGDGSNSNGSGIANALLLSGIVRSDIRSSIAGASGVAAGVPLTIKLQLVNTQSSCASLAGYAI